MFSVINYKINIFVNFFFDFYVFKDVIKFTFFFILFDKCSFSRSVENTILLDLKFKKHSLIL